MSEKMLRVAGPLVMTALAAACGFALWTEAGSAGGADLPTGRSPGFYASLGEGAIKTGDTGTALAAARLETAGDPGAYQAHQRLAYAALADAGAPTREALLALTTAYDLAPFPPADQMIWRVDLAEAFWAGMPDDLAARSLTQIEALGGMGMEWEPRIRWCRSATTEAIADAACATVPGVEKGADLKPKPGNSSATDG